MNNGNDGENGRADAFNPISESHASGMNLRDNTDRLSNSPIVSSDRRTDLVHQRVMHNGWFSYKTSTIAFVIIVTEFCERLAYYGVGGNLVLFFQTRLSYSNATADVNYSAWSGMCYVTPLLGGYIADSYLGRYNTIIIFASIYVVGLTMITISAVPGYTYVGLVMVALYVIALGTGGIKPNVCTLGADQFEDRISEEKEAKESFFSWFYFSINSGAAIAYIVISYICQYGAGVEHGGQEWGFYWGYLIPTISMLVGVLAFVAGKRLFGYADSGRIGPMEAVMTESSHSGDSSHALDPDQHRSEYADSDNPLLNPDVMQLRPLDIRREINRMRFFKRQQDLEARESSIRTSDADAAFPTLRTAADNVPTLRTAADEAEAGGARSAASATSNTWDQAWRERASGATVKADKAQMVAGLDASTLEVDYDDETIERWSAVILQEQEAARTDPRSSGVYPSLGVRLSLSKSLSNSKHSDVYILFGTLLQGLTLYVKHRCGCGSGKFTPPMAIEPAEEAVVETGIALSARGRSAPTTPSPSAPARETHILDYACQDNYRVANSEPRDSMAYEQDNGVGRYTRQQVSAAKLVTRLFPFLCVFVLFWTIYSQMSVGFQNQGCQMDLRTSSLPDAFKVPISALNLFDTLAILLIVPLLDKVVYPCLRRRNGTSPPLLQRILIGFFLAAAAMVVAGIVEQVRKQHLPTYDYSAGQGYYSDPVALANASPCATLDEYNPAAFEAWWKYNNAKRAYDTEMRQTGLNYVTIHGFKIFTDTPAPAYCRQTCNTRWFIPANIETSSPFATVNLNATCIACDPIPQVSSVSVLWQIPQFCLIGAAEVLASVSSLEFFYSQAPAQFRSVVQSFNLATTALGSLVVIPLILIVNSGDPNKAANEPSQINTTGGIWVPADLNYGHLDSFFFMLAALMCGNCWLLYKISRNYQYHDNASLVAAQNK